MSTITSSTSAVVAMPLTTPFVPPPLCRTVRDLTTTSTTSYVGSGSTYTASGIPYLFSDPANSDYLDCQPAGYQTSFQQSFSPGVCPQDWTAFDMTTSQVSSTIVSVATCCRPNFSLAFGDKVCTMLYELNHITSIPVTLFNGASTTTAVYYNGMFEAHPAWFIAWEKKDLSKLSPRPPDLTASMKIPAWTPGMTIPPGRYDNGGSGRQEGDPGTSNGLAEIAAFVYIGLPIIVVFLISSCCCCCFWKRTPMAKKRARAKAEAEAATAAVENGNQPAEDEESLPPRYSVDGGRHPLPDYALATMTPAISTPTTTIPPTR